MKIEQFKPDTLIRGTVFPELAKIITVVPVGDSYKNVSWH